MIMLAEVYTPEEDPLAVLARRDRGAISVYARGRDYHDVVKKRLKRLGRWLVAETGAEIKVFVDTAPVMEKPLAQAAGIGWQGKHTNLLSRELGQLVLPRGDLHHAGAAARRAGRGSLRVVPGLPRRLPDRGVSGALPARCPALHQLPDDRARRAGGRGAAAAARQPHLRLRRLPGGLPVEQVRGARRGRRGTAARAELEAPRLEELAALDDAGFRAAVQRLGDQADRAQPLRAQRGLCDRQFRATPGLLPAARRLAADADPVVRDAATGRWRGWQGAGLRRFDAPLQVARGRAPRGRCRDGSRSGAARRARRGRRRRSRRGRRRSRTAPRAGPGASASARSASASAAAGSPGVAQRGGEERVGEGVVGGGGERRRRARRARRASRRRRRRRGRAGPGGRASAAASAVGLVERGARRGRAGRRRATGAAASARTTARSAAAMRAVGVLARGRSGAARRWRGRRGPRAPSASQSRRRHAAAGARARARPSSRAAAGSAAMAAAQSSAERISAAGGGAAARRASRKSRRMARGPRLWDGG